MRTNTILFCILSLFILNGCAVSIPYGLYEDERSVDTVFDDTAIVAAVKGRLVDHDFGNAFLASVYCFNGHVFLIGEVDPPFRKEALDIARKTDQVKKVTAHWFTTPAISTTDDMKAKLNVATALINASGISSTQITANVHNGHVILLGVVENRGVANRVEAIAKSATGVKKVTSYLLY